MKSILFLSGKAGPERRHLRARSPFSARTRSCRLRRRCGKPSPPPRPEVITEGEFQGSKTAVKEAAKCIACGKCREVCRFQAIDDGYDIDPFLCEGCGACVYVCPTNAITLSPQISGHWYTAGTRLGPLASAELYPGEETSGKLVTLVKEKAYKLGKDDAAELLLIDGSPGIGCPVIASASGATAVILVTEPSLSGLHDLKRILGWCVTSASLPTS